MADYSSFDFTDEICKELLAILETYLPGALLEIAENVRPPAVREWHNASVGLVASSSALPCVTVTDEPPGGVEFKFLGVGIPPGNIPTVESYYTVYCAYAMDYKPTERAMSQVRKAKGAIAAVLAKHAVTNPKLADVDVHPEWKGGLPRSGSSGTGAIMRVNAPDATYIYGVVRWTCILHAGPPLT